MSEEWNPLAEPEPVTRELKVSGGKASVTYRRWTGRERLAYEDAMTVRILVLDESGDQTVLMGTLAIFQTALTVQSSDGFGVDGFLSGDVAKRESDLLSITDRKTLLEIVRTAREIQPPPGVDDTAEKTEPDDPDDPDDPEGGEEGDPSPTPPTPQTPTGDVAPSGSPEESTKPRKPTRKGTG